MKYILKHSTMDKLKFMKRAFLGTAIVSAIAFVFVGIFSPIEQDMSLFGHIMKCVFGWAWVTVILETFMYTLGQIAYHWADDYKEKYGKGWFWKGLKEDFKYLKENITWKKTFKVLCTFILFFMACGVIFFLLELLVP